MDCSINELRLKEVIDVTDGERLGFVSDARLDLESGKILSVIVPGAYRLMGFLGREEDMEIEWENIKKIGDDVIIVENLKRRKIG